MSIESLSKIERGKETLMNLEKEGGSTKNERKNEDKEMKKI